MYMTLIYIRHLYENCLRNGWQKHDQTERWSGLLVSVSLLGAQRNPTKIPSHFIPLKTPANQRYYRDCVLLSYTKTEKWSYRWKRVINNKTKKIEITNKQV